MFSLFVHFLKPASRRASSLIFAISLLILSVTPGSAVYPAGAFLNVDYDCDGSSALPQAEYDALGEFYNLMGGSNWANRDNWGSATVQVNSWYGVTCAGGHVTGLRFTNNNLHGQIPAETLRKLPNLEELMLVQEPGITGSIPPALGGEGGLLNLRTLALQEIGLTGEIPADLQFLVKLESISIGDNGLSGDVPHWINKLPNLRVLRLYYSGISGDIPSEICELTELYQVQLLGLHLSGTIPPCMSSLTGLRNLDLSWNDLEGPLPDIFTYMTGLVTLGLELNHLTGPIPESITNLKNLVRYDSGYPGLYSTSLNYNMLTASQNVDNFLRTIDLNWESTQVLPPSGFQGVSETPNSVRLSWNPRSGFGGHYNIFYAPDPDGTYVKYGETVNRTQASIVVENLLSEVPYAFKIQTVMPFPYPDWPTDYLLSPLSDPITVTTLSGGDQIDVSPADTTPKTLLYTGESGSTTTITIPAGAASETATLSYVPITRYVGFNFTDKMFTLTAFENSMPSTGYTFNTPVTFQVGYTEAELNGQSEGSLVILLYDPQDKTWKDAAESCTPASTYERDLEANWMRVDVCHLTLFALGDDQPYRINLPVIDSWASDSALLSP